MALMDDDWEARMAARAAQRRRDRLRVEQEAAEPWLFQPEPPDDGTCRDCWEWVLDCIPLGRYIWRSTCGFMDCGHHCHPPKDQRYVLAAATG